LHHMAGPYHKKAKKAPLNVLGVMGQPPLCSWK